MRIFRILLHFILYWCLSDESWIINTQILFSGGYQPDLRGAGDVRRFRLSLWAEHFKYSEPIFLHPTTLECVRRVKDMVAYNWNQYLSQQNTPGQLLPYPLNVMPDGKLECIDGISHFPDFPESAKIKGKPNPMIPQKVTTWKTH